jgi:catecholate siderophore receptor
MPASHNKFHSQPKEGTMSFRIRRLHGLMAAACVFTLPAALAAETEEATLAPVVARDTKQTAGSYDAPLSRTATKVQAAQRDIPQIVNVVPQPLLREQNATSVQDALQNVPGLSFSVGDGQRDQVTIRGFSAIYDQFVDGLRDDAMYFRDLSNVERIEVLKGPGSVLYGRGSSGGIVNRVTKKPRAEPRQELGLTLGTEGQKRAEFDFGAAPGERSVLFRVTGAVEDSEGFRNQYFLERRAIAPSLTFKLGDATTLTAQADYLKDKRLADQGIPGDRSTGRPANVPRETYYGAANGRERAFVESEVASGTLTLDHRFNADWSFHSALRHYNYSLDRNYTTIDTKSIEATPTAFNINQVRRLRDETGTFWQNELTQKLTLGDTRHQLLYGVEIGRQSKAEQLYNNPKVATYNLFAPVLTALGPMPAVVKASNDNSTRIENTALYVQDLMELGTRWKVLGGLRYDRLKQNRDDRTTANLDIPRTDNTVSPRLGVVYQLSDSTSLYAAYSRSFQPLADQFTFFGNSKDLEPMRTVNRELGAKFDIGTRASASVAVFDMEQNSAPVANPAKPSEAMSAGSQRTRGLELSFNGALDADWELIAGYAWMDSEVSSPLAAFDGKEGALTPRQSANLWLKRRLPGGYYVAGGGRAEASRFASPTNAIRLPGYGVLNLAAGYQGKDVEVNLTLRNLLDRKYFVAAHSGADDYNLPGEPRTLMVTTRIRF